MQSSGGNLACCVAGGAAPLTMASKQEVRERTRRDATASAVDEVALAGTRRDTRFITNLTPILGLHDGPGALLCSESQRPRAYYSSRSRKAPPRSARRGSIIAVAFLIQTGRRIAQTSPIYVWNRPCTTDLPKSAV